MKGSIKKIFSYVRYITGENIQGDKAKEGRFWWQGKRGSIFWQSKRGSFFFWTSSPPMLTFFISVPGVFTLLLFFCRLFFSKIKNKKSYTPCYALLVSGTAWMKIDSTLPWMTHYRMFSCTLHAWTRCVKGKKKKNDPLLLCHRSKIKKNDPLLLCHPVYFLTLHVTFYYLDILPFLLRKLFMLRSCARYFFFLMMIYFETWIKDIYFTVTHYGQEIWIILKKKCSLQQNISS